MDQWQLAKLFVFRPTALLLFFVRRISEGLLKDDAGVTLNQAVKIFILHFKCVLYNIYFIVGEVVQTYND
jgi:hypothetical protein